MRTLLFTAIAAMLILPSCRTEVINCEPGYINGYAVGFAGVAAVNAKMVRYIANTDSATDSTGLYTIDPAFDTVRLGPLMPGYDYKLHFNDSLVYVVNNITLSGVKQQTFKTSIANTKGLGCIERVVSYDLNGIRISTIGNKYNDIYIIR